MAPLGILFSPDMGLVAWLSWLLFLWYLDFFDENGRFAWKRELIHLGSAVAGWILSWGGTALIMKLSYGHFPDFGQIFLTMRTFSAGYYTLPMKAIHPWGVAALVAIAGLAWSIARIERKSVKATDSMILILSLMFFGSFAYFQGRSHNGNLWLPTVYVILLLTVFADKLWNRIRQGERFYWMLFPLLLFVLFFSLPEAYAKLPMLQKLSKPYHSQRVPEDKVRIAQNKQFMDACVEENEPAIVLTSKKYAAFYFDGRKQASALNPGFMEIFTREAYEHIKDVLYTTQSPVFIDKTFFYYTSFTDLRSLVASRYQVLDYNQARFSVLRPRTEKLPAAVLSSEADDILYRKYTDDTVGYAARIRDARGTEALLDPEGDAICMEIVFFNTLQHYQAALLSNLTQEGGIGIFSISDAQKNTFLQVYFGMNGVASFSLPQNTWCYLTLQFKGSDLQVFCNGKLLSDTKINDTYRPSPLGLSVGNFEDMRNFIGGISEVRISRGWKDKAYFISTWERLDSILAH